MLSVIVDWRVAFVICCCSLFNVCCVLSLVGCCVLFVACCFGVRCALVVVA